MSADKHRFTFLYLRLSALICGLILLSACFQNPQNNNSEIPEQPPAIPTPNINLAEPLRISEKPEDVEKCKNINQIIEQSEFANARWGIIAISLKDGRVVCERDGQKILTSVVALDKLGADFRWKTLVYAKSEIENGVLNGDLILYGNGAPDFAAKDVENLVAQLKAKGLREIKGDIIGDESYFKGDDIGDGWAWNELQWYYGAAASALSFDRNLENVSINNGKIKVEPDGEEFETSADVTPSVTAGQPAAIGLNRELGTNKLYAWGQGNNLEARVSVNDPALLTAKKFKRTLEKDGVKISGKVRSADWKSADKLNVENAKELANVESQTLSEIVRVMNKDSVNIYAELILRTLGKNFGETAPDENPKLNKLRGDDSAGATVIEKWLKDNNISADEIQIHDGSGLSRLDFVTPESVAKALIFASQSKFADVFKNSLPVAGQTGTLKGRLGSASGNIVAKTGSITYVNALAGFANTNDETFAFVIFCNNETRKNDSVEIVDKIAVNLIEQTK
jgi:serine-type D-Ala-D-Ala carboxypeptidase/endopeptidase (penicillin-binding protein 4)